MNIRDILGDSQHRYQGTNTEPAWSGAGEFGKHSWLFGNTLEELAAQLIKVPAGAGVCFFNAHTANEAMNIKKSLKLLGIKYTGAHFVPWSKPGYAWMVVPNEVLHFKATLFAILTTTFMDVGYPLSLLDVGTGSGKLVSMWNANPVLGPAFGFDPVSENIYDDERIYIEMGTDIRSHMFNADLQAFMDALDARRPAQMQTWGNSLNPAMTQLTQQPASPEPIDKICNVVSLTGTLHGLANAETEDFDGLLEQFVRFFRALPELCEFFVCSGDMQTGMLLTKCLSEAGLELGADYSVAKVIDDFSLYDISKQVQQTHYVFNFIPSNGHLKYRRSPYRTSGGR